MYTDRKLIMDCKYIRIIGLMLLTVIACKPETLPPLSEEEMPFPDVYAWDPYLKVPKPEKGIIRPVEFSPDGTLLLTFNEKYGIQLWNTTNGRLINNIGFEQPDLSLHSPNIPMFSPDGTFFILPAYPEGPVIVRESATGKIVKVDERKFSKRPQFSDDSRYLALIDRKNSLIVWETSTWKYKTPSKAFHDKIEEADFYGDKNYLATSGPGAKLRIWELETGNLVKELPQIYERHGCIKFCPKADRFVTVGDSEIAELWRVSDLTKIKTIKRNMHSFDALFSPNGEYVLLYHSMSIGLYKTKDGSEWMKSLDGMGDFSFSSDSRYLCASSYFPVSIVYDVEERKKILFHDQDSGDYHMDAQISPRGDMIRESAGKNMVWHIRQNREIFKGSDGWVVFSPCGERMAALSKNKELYLLKFALPIDEKSGYLNLGDDRYD